MKRQTYQPDLYEQLHQFPMTSDVVKAEKGRNPQQIPEHKILAWQELTSQKKIWITRDCRFKLDSNFPLQ